MLWQTSQLPGLHPISEDMNERSFREWMESKPKGEVGARIAQGDYSLLGLERGRDPDCWIPGVAGHKHDQGRNDVTYIGIGGRYEKYIQKAEIYMTEFNELMLEARKDVTLDVYGHSNAHKYFIHNKQTEPNKPSGGDGQ